MVHVTGGLERVVPGAKVEEFEFVSGGRLELWLLDVHAAYPIALALETFDEMMTDEATGAGD
jgi:hypothetical protein